MDMGHAEIAEIYRDLQETPPLLRLDVYPSQYAPVFTADNALPQYVKWGFDGSYGKQLIINARAETVADKPFFARDFACNRCAVPCSGFYEWDDGKRRHLFMRADGKAMYLAGFCKTQDTERFVILTAPAVPPVAPLHSRIPVLLNKDDIRNYLGDREFARKVLLQTAADLNIVEE